MYLTDKDILWIDAAINGELDNIERLSSEAKPPKLTKPDSPITLAMLKIASVVKGYGLEPYKHYECILYALRCHPVSSKPREIEYQWKRCMNRARPRRRPADLVDFPV